MIDCPSYPFLPLSIYADRCFSSAGADWKLTSSPPPKAESPSRVYKAFVAVVVTSNSCLARSNLSLPILFQGPDILIEPYSSLYRQLAFPN